MKNHDQQFNLDKVYAFNAISRENTRHRSLIGRLTKTLIMVSLVSLLGVAVVLSLN